MNLSGYGYLVDSLHFSQTFHSHGIALYSFRCCPFVILFDVYACNVCRFQNIVHHVWFNWSNFVCKSAISEILNERVVSHISNYLNCSSVLMSIWPNYYKCGAHFGWVFVKWFFEYSTVLLLIAMYVRLSSSLLTFQTSSLYFLESKKEEKVERNWKKTKKFDPEVIVCIEHCNNWFKNKYIERYLTCLLLWWFWWQSIK